MSSQKIKYKKCCKTCSVEGCSKTDNDDVSFQFIISTQKPAVNFAIYRQIRIKVRPLWLISGSAPEHLWLCKYVATGGGVLAKTFHWQIDCTGFIIPRDAEGYSVELFGLSVCLSAWLSVCLSVRPSVCLSHPWRGSLRHVCNHTNHRTTIIHTFLERPSDLDVHPRIRFLDSENFRRNWRLKVHYVEM